jgi:hypothetical protein
MLTRSQPSFNQTHLTPEQSNKDQGSQTSGSQSGEIHPESKSENLSRESDKYLSFTSLGVCHDLSKDYKSNLRSKKRRTVSF